MSTASPADEGCECGDPAAGQKYPAERCVDTGGGELAQSGGIRVGGCAEIPSDAVAYRDISDQAEHDAHRPRHRGHGLESALLAFGHELPPLSIPWLPH